MRIRMLAERTGPRWDGQAWPPVGGEIDVPDDEGMGLCAQGIAVPVAVSKAEVPEKPDPAVEMRASVQAVAVAGVGAAEAPEPGAAPEPDMRMASEPQAAEPLAKPIAHAPKAEWVDFAASHGFDRSVAESMTKADLIARFRDQSGAPADTGNGDVT